MKWSLATAGILSACAFSTTTAGAAPIAGSHIGSTLESPTYLYFLTPGGALDGGLIASGCPFLPQAPYSEAHASTLNITLNGWYGPMQNTDTNPNQLVRVRAHVAGTVEDAAGNIYKAAGNFLDVSVHYLFGSDLLFDGTGMMTLAGSSGVVAGEAEFRAVNAPLEFDFTFTNIRQCNVTPRG